MTEPTEREIRRVAVAIAGSELLEGGIAPDEVLKIMSVIPDAAAAKYRSSAAAAIIAIRLLDADGEAA